MMYYKPYMLINKTASFSYDTDAQAFFTAAGITDSTQKSAINQLVLDFKSYGIWSKMYAIYPFVGGSATTHKYNLKDPRDLDAAFRLTFPNGATHSAQGVDWNGTNQYANTFFTPSSSGFTTSSGGFSYYSREDGSAGSVIEMGSVDSNSREQIIACKFTGPTIGAAYGAASSAQTVSNSNGSGLIGVNRTSTNLEAYRNGSRIINFAQTASLSTRQMFLGAYSNDGTAAAFSSRQCAYADIHQMLTTTEQANKYTAVQAFQTTLSRAV